VETGNDYFGARYLSSAQGRWTIPDWSAKASPVPYATLNDPQTLNLYGYVRNNPLAFADHDGHVLTVFGDAVDQYLAALQKASGLTLKRNEKTGRVTIGKRPKELSAVGKEIATIIGDTKNTVKMEAVSSVQGGGVVGGQFLGKDAQGNGEQLLDFGTIGAMSKPGGFTVNAIATHETVEAYQGLLNGENFPAAHNVATIYENLERVAEGLGPRTGDVTVWASPTVLRSTDYFPFSRDVIDYDTRSGSIAKVTVVPTNQPNPAAVVQPVQ
jgi:RHS repeat-associated protein